MRIVKDVCEKMGKQWHPDMPGFDRSAYGKVVKQMERIMPHEAYLQLANLGVHADQEVCVVPNWRELCDDISIKKAMYDILTGDVEKFLEDIKTKMATHNSKAEEIERELVRTKGYKIGLQPGHADKKFLEFCFHKYVVVKMENTIEENKDVHEKLTECSKRWMQWIYREEADKKCFQSKV